MKKVILGAAVAALPLIAPVEAAVVIDVQEVGGNVVFTTTGSLDLTGATYFSTTQYDVGVISGGSNWYIASGSGSSVDTYKMTSFDGAFGTNTTFLDSPSATSGDDFFIWGEGGSTEQVGVKGGYVSGSNIFSTMSYFGTTFAAMGMTQGQYIYSIPSDTIALNIGGSEPSAVPLPATLPLLLIGLGGVGVLARRRRVIC